MPKFSPRISHRRVSRIVVTSVLIVTVIGSAYEFHRMRKSDAVPPVAMSVSPSVSGNVAAPALVKTSESGKPVSTTPVVAAPVIATPVIATPVIATLVTQTPDQKLRSTPNQLLPVNNVTRPDQVKPISVAQTPAPAPVSAPVSAPVAAPAQSQINSSTLLSEASAKTTAGDLIGARDLLNSALASNKLSANDIDTVKKQLAEINQTLVFSPRQFPKDPLGGVYTVKSGDRLAAIGTAHQVPYELLLQLNRMTDAKKLRYGQTLKVINGPFHVVVSKSRFIMDVYLGGPGGENSTYITSFPVGLGTDNSTPTGTWSIKNKVTHPTYFPPEGHAGPVLDPNDPKNPLGSYWMGLEGTDGQAVGQRSYGIHGTIDPTSIGKQSSMGCIRLKNEDVEQLYKLLVPSKSIVVVKD